MDHDRSSAQPIDVNWRAVARAINRPYRVTLPMVLLVSIVPLYIFIAASARGGRTHVPATAIDRLLPLEPIWVLVYGPLYLWLILLPVFVIQQHEHIRRTVLAYLAVWLSSYVVFLIYPTVASRPESVSGDGFAAWGLRFLYDADPPYNCFPSLHVAHSFVSAFAVSRVNRSVGGIAIVAASLVAVSTLFTKQHYAGDVAAGVMLAAAVYVLSGRGLSIVPAVSELERLLAPRVAACVAGIVGIVVMMYFSLYRLSV